MESKAETLEKEYQVRLLEASQGGTKTLTTAKKLEIRKQAEEWIENGVKATPDKRLGILRAMFHFARKRGTIKDVPHFPKVDNRKRKFFNEAQRTGQTSRCRWFTQMERQSKASNSATGTARLAIRCSIPRIFVRNGVRHVTH